MKNIGYLVIVGSLVIGIIIGNLPVGFPIEPLVGISFLYFLLGIYILALDKGKKGRVPKMRNPPAPPERGLKISIDDSLRKNEAFARIMDQLKEANPTIAPIQIEGNFNLLASTKKKCLCKEASNKGRDAGCCLYCFSEHYKEGSVLINKPIPPEMPKDRIEWQK
jgi:hypothetical protein